MSRDMLRRHQNSIRPRSRQSLATLPTLRVGVGLLFLWMLAGSAVAQGEGPPPQAVRAVRAALRETVQREAVTGSLRAAHDATLAAREGGPVEEVRVREGAVVRAGEVLLRLDDRRLVAARTESAASLAEAEANVLRRTAESEDARMDLASLEAAAESSSSSVSERELRAARTRSVAAKADAEAAEQRVAAMRAQLELADIRVSDATLVAPYDGTIVALHVEAGEWVMPGAALFELVSTKKLEVWLDVPERLLAALQGSPESLPIRVGGLGGDVTASRVRIVPRVDDRSRKFPVILDVTVPEGRSLTPGMSASAWLPVGERRQTLMVPKDALVYRPGGISVMVVMGADEGGASLQGVATQVPIGILFETAREVAVAPGALEAGAVVIVEGNERLFPGTPVAASIGAPLGDDAAGDDAVGSGR